MFRSILYLFVLFLFLAACASNVEETPEVITPAQAKAMEQYFDFDINFSDTIVKYKMLDNQLELDFGDTQEKRWSVTAFWQNEEGKDLCYTKSGKSYSLDGRNKLLLDLPDEYDAIKDEIAKFFIGACPSGKSYISNFDKYNAMLTTFFYRDSGNNVLKPTGREWLQMKHIKHRVNYMKANSFHDDEVIDFIVKKEAEILQELVYVRGDILKY